MRPHQLCHWALCRQLASTFVLMLLSLPLPGHLGFRDLACLIPKPLYHICLMTVVPPVLIAA